MCPRSGRESLPITGRGSFGVVGGRVSGCTCREVDRHAGTGTKVRFPPRHVGGVGVDSRVLVGEQVNGAREMRKRMLVGEKSLSRITRGPQHLAAGFVPVYLYLHSLPTALRRYNLNRCLLGGSGPPDPRLTGFLQKRRVCVLNDEARVRGRVGTRERRVCVLNDDAQVRVRRGNDDARVRVRVGIAASRGEEDRPGPPDDPPAAQPPRIGRDDRPQRRHVVRQSSLWGRLGRWARGSSGEPVVGGDEDRRVRPPTRLVASGGRRGSSRPAADEPVCAR